MSDFHIVAFVVGCIEFLDCSCVVKYSTFRSDRLDGQSIPIVVGHLDWMAAAARWTTTTSTQTTIADFKPSRVYYCTLDFDAFSSSHPILQAHHTTTPPRPHEPSQPSIYSILVRCARIHHIISDPPRLTSPRSNLTKHRRITVVVEVQSRDPGRS